MSQAISSPTRASSVLPGLIQRAKKSPTPNAVHKLRTTIRRMEAALSTSCEFENRKKLLKQVARLRKAAGHVRDVDVHLGILQGLDRPGMSSDSRRLKHSLKQRREKRETKLVNVLEKQVDGGIIKRLKQAALIGIAPAVSDNGVAIRAIALEFLAEAAPTPKEDALHHLRLDCKHLRYLASLLQSRMTAIR